MLGWNWRINWKHCSKLLCFPDYPISLTLKKGCFSTWLGHGAYVHALLPGHEAQHGEDGKAGQETGAAVQEA